MFQKIIHFIKYNNATILILATILMLGAGVFAASPETIGQKQTQIIGVDNALLIQFDLDNFDMDFKIENIKQDDRYYYVTYTYLDLVVINQAWQYQLSEKTAKISLKIKQDIGVYMAKYLSKHYEARIRELKQEKNQALASGEQNRIEVTEYTGLVGKTLDLVAEVFPGYEPVKKLQLPTPSNFDLPNNNANALISSGTDDLKQVYDDYIAEHNIADTNILIDTNDTNNTNNTKIESVEIVELLAEQATTTESTTTTTSEPVAEMIN